MNVVGVASVTVKDSLNGRSGPVLVPLIDPDNFKLVDVNRSNVRLRNNVSSLNFVPFPADETMPLAPVADR